METTEIMNILLIKLKKLKLLLQDELLYDFFRYIFLDLSL